MIQVRDVLGRARPLAVAAVFTAAAFLPIAASHFASAGVLTERSLKLSSSLPSDSASIDPGATEGTALSNKVSHTYTFTVEDATGGAIQGLRFGVYTDAFGYIGNTLNTGDGNGVGEVVAFDATNAPDAVVINRTTDPSGASPASFTTSSTGVTTWRSTGNISVSTGDVIEVAYVATATDYFTNPSSAYTNAQGTFFVRAETFADSALATPRDQGTVTSAIVPSIDITARVKETLKFSVEADQRLGSAAPNGATAPGGTCDPLNPSGTQTSLLIGEAVENTLDAQQPYDGFSYFRLATNSANGAGVYYAGDTLRSGGEFITAVSDTGELSATNGGIEQFGLGLDTTDASHDFTNLSAAGPYGAASGAFGTASFAFDTGSVADPVLVAESTGTVSCDTGTVRYLANIAEDTAAGIYTTKITYIASPAY